MTWTTSNAALRAGASVAALATSGALLLTACSSSSGTPSAAGQPSGSVSVGASAPGKSGASGNNAQAMDKYRQCLSQHGVNLPTFARRSPGAPRPSGSPGAGGGRGFGGGRFGGGGFPGFGGASPDAATQKALDACKALRPQFTGRGGAGGGANGTAFKAFASCLKDHGVVLPTPSPGATASGGRGGYGGFGGGFGGLRGLNTADPKTAKAYETCRALLPARPAGSGAPSATT